MKEGRGDRTAFLVSGLAHLVILFAALNRVTAPRPTPVTTPRATDPADSRDRVFLPPPEVVAALRERPRPTPPATPRPGRDRMSVGGPSPLRQQGPLQLRRDEEITRELGRGSDRPDSVPAPEEGPGPQAPEASAAGAPLAVPPTATPPSSPLRLPPIAGTLRRFEDRLARGGGLAGSPSGTTQQFGPLLFDPQGADFTAWVNHFRIEVYRNWILPQISMGGGHVDISFVVRRDGSVERLTVLKGTGNPALDRAAANALLSSRLRPLPADYAPAELVLEVTFHYQEVRRS